MSDPTDTQVRLRAAVREMTRLTVKKHLAAHGIFLGNAQPIASAVDSFVEEIVDNLEKAGVI